MAWEEDDYISVCHPHGSLLEGGSISYECFEYVNEPILQNNRKECKGQQQITLPPYGDSFIITYNRTRTIMRKTYEEINGKKEEKIIAIKRYIELARTSILNVLCIVRLHHPDQAMINNTLKRNQGTNDNIGKGTILRRRGSSSTTINTSTKKDNATTINAMNKDESNNRLLLVLEDFQGIKTLTITALSVNKNYFLCRINAWLYFDINTVQWVVYVEADLYHREENHLKTNDNKKEYQTYISNIMIPKEWLRGYVEVKGISEGIDTTYWEQHMADKRVELGGSQGLIEDDSTKAIIRIPYANVSMTAKITPESNIQPGPPSRTSYLCKPSSLTSYMSKQRVEGLSVQICCGFCSNILTYDSPEPKVGISSKQWHVAALPEGHFDQVRYTGYVMYVQSIYSAYGCHRNSIKARCS